MAARPALVDRTNRYVLKRPGYLCLLPKRPGGEAFALCRYVLLMGSIKIDGKTDQEGLIKTRVPRRAKRAELRLWDAEDPEAAPHVWPLTLGPRPPIHDIAGVQWRLENLGFDCGDEYGTEGPETRAAIRAFEEWIGLKSAAEELANTGTIEREAAITDKTRRVLDDVYARKAGLHHGGELQCDDEKKQVEGA